MARPYATPISATHTLVVALLVGTLAACGGGGEDNAAPDPTASTSATTGSGAAPVPTLSPDPETGPNDYCEDQQPYTGPAADKFGADEVMDAYCTFVTLEVEQSFIDDYLRADDPDMTVQDFSVWHDYMTKETADLWDATVTKALSTGNMNTKQDVWSLMFYNALTGSGYSFPAEEPTTLNTAFTPADTDVDNPAGKDRLVLAFNVSGDLNVVKDDAPDNPLLIHLDRRIVFSLIRNPAPSDEKTDWLIDAWTGKFTIGKPRNRGPLPSATP